MGKWSGLKNNLVKFEHPPDYQSRVDEVKQHSKLRDRADVDLCELYGQMRDKKDALESQVKELNLQLEAVQQELVERMEEQGITGIKTLDHGNFFLKDDPYSSVQDRSAFHQWIRETGQEGLFTVMYQTANGIVKECLSSGKPLPPGMAVFMKTSVTRRL